VRIVPDDGFTLHMMGIGGTGVVTVNQILGTAALLDGRHVRSLDQTGLSQKGGPVVSDLKLFSDGAAISNRALAGGADLYLGFDVLVAATPANLEKADPERTVAVISTTRVPTGKMVADVNASFPDLAGLRSAIDRVSRSSSNVYLDAQGLAEALFGDPMASNLLLLGAAYQAGAVPVSAASIQEAIRLNGVQIEMNLAAFEWGRLAVLDLASVEEAGWAQPRQDRAPRISAEAQRLIDSAGVDGEARRLLETRVPDLIGYQDAAYARQYVDFVRRVHETEQKQTPARTGITEAVARYLYKLMAIKDEYEVARLHLDLAVREEIRQTFGEGAKMTWHLQPPILEKLGRHRKTRFGPWFRPAFVALRAMKALRGTPLDPFNCTPIRRLDRALAGEYRQLIEHGLARLSPETHGTVLALAGLPDLIRGYDHVRLAGVQRYRAEADQLLASLDQPAAPDLVAAP
jgi:indolepyruvate ferredoxin oxidoreductase